jgi:hypothetical protein
MGGTNLLYLYKNPPLPHFPGSRWSHVTPFTNHVRSFRASSRITSILYMGWTDVGLKSYRGLASSLATPHKFCPKKKKGSSCKSLFVFLCHCDRSSSSGISSHDLRPFPHNCSWSHQITSAFNEWKLLLNSSVVAAAASKLKTRPCCRPHKHAGLFPVPPLPAASLVHRHSPLLIPLQCIFRPTVHISQSARLSSGLSPLDFLPLHPICLLCSEGIRVAATCLLPQACNPTGRSLHSSVLHALNSSIRSSLFWSVLSWSGTLYMGCTFMKLRYLKFREIAIWRIWGMIGIS